MTSHTSEARSRNRLRVSLDLPPVVEAGWRFLLADHRDRVSLLPTPVGGDVDVEVVARWRPDPESTPVDEGEWGPGQLGLTVVARSPWSGRSHVVPWSVRTRDLLGTLERLVDEPVGRSAATDGTAPVGVGRDADLSMREADVIALICAGLTNDEIAMRLFLSINSVKTYIRSAYRKMGVSRRSQAILWGHARGFLSSLESADAAPAAQPAAASAAHGSGGSDNG